MHTNISRYSPGENDGIGNSPYRDSVKDINYGL